MSTATKTLKLPFLRLNRTKANEFARLQTLNTSVANAMVAMPKAERHKLTSKSFAHVEIGSAWINQTIRNANAAMNIRDWQGWCCPLVLEAPVDGAHDLPPNTVRDAAGEGRLRTKNVNLSHGLSPESPDFRPGRMSKYGNPCSESRLHVSCMPAS